MLCPYVILGVEVLASLHPMILRGLAVFTLHTLQLISPFRLKPQTPRRDFVGGQGPFHVNYSTFMRPA